MVGKKQKEKDDQETVCLNDKQMKNLIEAARADGSNDKKAKKKACQKALKFVQTYLPQKKESPGPDRTIERFTISKIIKFFKSKIPDTKGWF